MGTLDPNDPRLQAPRPPWIRTPLGFVLPLILPTKAEHEDDG